MPRGERLAVKPRAWIGGLHEERVGEALAHRVARALTAHEAQDVIAQLRRIEGAGEDDAGAAAVARLDVAEMFAFRHDEDGKIEKARVVADMCAKMKRSFDLAFGHEHERVELRAGK